MRAGNLKLLYMGLILVFFETSILNGEEKINLNILQPTFEEEAEINETIVNERSKIKSKEKKKTKPEQRVYGKPKSFRQNNR